MTATTPDQLTPAAGGPMARVARLLGCTEGQAYTVVIGTVVALVAALLGLPPTLRDRGAPAASSATGGQAGAPAAGGQAPAGSPEVAEAPAAAGGVDFPAAAGGTSGIGTDSGGSSPSTGTADADTGAGTGTGAGTDAGTSEPTGGSATSPGPAAATAFGPAGVRARVGDPGAPEGVAVDGDGRVYVATNNGLLRGESGASKVIRYGPDGKPQAELAVTGQETSRTSGLTGLVLAPDGGVLVLDSQPARVLRVDVDAGSQDTYAELTDLPPCTPPAAGGGCEPGPDGRPQLRGAVLDGQGNLFVTDSGQGVIWRVPADGRAEPWFTFPEGEAAAGPTGVALDAAGDLLVVTSMSLPPSTGRGVIQRIDVRDDGTAGDRKTLAATDPLSGPVGLTVLPDGSMVLALTSANVLLLLGPDGAEKARLTADDVAQQAEVPLDGPTGVTTREGSVLVTNQSPTANDAAHWVVFDVALT